VIAAGKLLTGRCRKMAFILAKNYDRRLEQPGWNLAGFDDEGWEKVEEVKGHRLSLRISHQLK